jgi:hypothetical protein
MYANERSSTQDRNSIIPQEYRYGRAPTLRHRHVLSKTAIESYLSSHRNAVATCCSPAPCQQAESYPNPPRASHQSRTNVTTEPPRQYLRTTRTSMSSAASHAKHCYEQLILDIHRGFRQLSTIASSRRPSQHPSSHQYHSRARFPRLPCGDPLPYPLYRATCFPAAVLTKRHAEKEERWPRCRRNGRRD